MRPFKSCSTAVVLLALLSVVVLTSAFVDKESHLPTRSTPSFWAMAYYLTSSFKSLGKTPFLCVLLGSLSNNDGDVQENVT